jgi:hypothetical protein
VPSLEDKLNMTSLVLLAWRMQNEPDLQLGWLTELFKEDTAGSGTARPQLACSSVRNQLGGAALNSNQS